MTKHTPATPKDLANAQIMAAAPDLLAALETFVQAYEESFVITDDDYCIARTAIAKARGEG